MDLGETFLNRISSLYHTGTGSSPFESIWAFQMSQTRYHFTSNIDKIQANLTESTCIFFNTADLTQTQPMHKMKN